eukprot:1756910-Rhodomonas_salina.2
MRRNETGFTIAALSISCFKRLWSWSWSARSCSSSLIAFSSSICHGHSQPPPNIDVPRRWTEMKRDAEGRRRMQTGADRWMKRDEKG